MIYRGYSFSLRKYWVSNNIENNRNSIFEFFFSYELNSLNERRDILEFADELETYTNTKDLFTISYSFLSLRASDPLKKPNLGI